MFPRHLDEWEFLTHSEEILYAPEVEAMARLIRAAKSN
jgi:hypothetical protein